MKLLRVPDSAACVDALVHRLTMDLAAGNQTLWFMTGGSNIAVDVAVMSQLTAEHTKHLTVTLTDERYGPYGHKDSNWQQLIDQGLDLQYARSFSVLQENNLSLDDTTELFARNLETTLQAVDSVIGFYGLGPDGHIAGILPNTKVVDATGPATSYQTDTFTRITSTFATIRRCHVAYMYAGGASKLAPLEHLQQSLPLAEQPAQILKEIPEAYVYNDQIGDSE